MAYDLAPIMAILISIIPIMLIVYVFRYFRKVLGTLESPKKTYRHSSRAVKAVGMLYAFLMVSAFMVPLAAGAATASPSTGTALVNFPFPITYAGLNASATYAVYDNGVANGVTFTASTEGTATYTYSTTSVGTHTIALKQTTPAVGGTLAASCTITVTDVIADYFLPIMMIAIVLSVLGSIIYMIDKELKS